MIDLNIITQLISPIIVIACLCLGYVIKYGFKNKTLNAFIPCLLACLGMAANVWNTGIIDFTTIITGAVSGLAATGLYEAFTNILNLPKLEADNNNDDVEIKYGKHFDE